MAKDSEESADEASQDSESEKASAKASEPDDVEASGAIEVKDAETLWKVNIEAVYRRKNPSPWPDCSCHAVPRT